MTKRKQKQPEPRHCKLCGQAEKRMDVGVVYTTIAPRLGICVDCINRAMKR